MRIGNRRSLFGILAISGLGALVACSSGAGDGDARGGGGREGAPASPSATAAALPRPSWATPDRFVGRLPADAQIPIQVHLRLRNEAQADEELAAISDPDDPRFGQYLTDDELAAKYLPTEEDVAAVRAHLEGHGIVVERVPSSRLFVSARGTAAQVEAAFGARLAQYRVDGALRHAPMDAARVPAALASRVSTVLGLSTSPSFAPRRVQIGGIKRDALKPDDSAGASACSEWFGAAADTSDPPLGGDYPPLTYAPCGYKPGQLRAAYGFKDMVRRGNDGRGVSIAIVDAFLSPTLLEDAQTYAAQNDPDYPLLPTQFSTVTAPGTPMPPDPGWYGEATLDVEAAHAMAPGANIVFVSAQSPTDQDLLAALNEIVDKKLATIVSNSYGSPEGLLNNFVAWQAVVKQAGLKGIGVYFASGDNGDESTNLGTAAADFPASMPGVTAVGGTSLGLGRQAERLFEVGWETGATLLSVPQPPPPPYDGGYDGGEYDGGFFDAGSDGGSFDAGGGDGGAGSLLRAAMATAGDGGTTTSGGVWYPPPPGFFAFGSGGGTSRVYDQPKWQKDVVPAPIANRPGVPARAVPDVAMLGDPFTGFLMGQTQGDRYGEYAIGGTSLACPLFAGVMALVEQRAHRAIGFANPQLYKARTKNAFVDVAPGAAQDVALPNGVAITFEYPNLSIHTAVGYDDVTGLGTPNGEAFARAVK